MRSASSVVTTEVSIHTIVVPGANSSLMGIAMIRRDLAPSVRLGWDQSAFPRLVLPNLPLPHWPIWEPTTHSCWNERVYLFALYCMKMTAVYVFTRDLRLVDNTGLNHLARNNLKILPVFMFPPEQIDPNKNPYFSNNCVQFMCESLEYLDNSLKSLRSSLVMLRGSHSECLERIRKAVAFEQVHMTQDVTPYSDVRSEKIRKWCDKHDVSFHLHEDVDLLPMDEGLRKEGEPYQVFSPYFKHVNMACKVRPIDVLKLNSAHFLSKQVKLPKKTLLDIKDLTKFYKANQYLAVHGGRKEALKRLKMIDGLKDYGKKRDYPALDKSTTMLSAYIKFGCVSIREVYWKAVKKFSKTHDFVRELWFRSFYYHVAKHHPHMLQGRPFKLKYEGIQWRDDKEGLQRWRNGTTGIPLCDAGMRNLVATGHLHNRVRMVVASVLCKLLLIDWRAGERAMATYLVDFDPVSNNSGWQTIASTMCDGEPYYRPMNPFRQSVRFDPDAEYIKKWVPELRDVPAKAIHEWGTTHSKFVVNYPPPIVDTKKARERAKKIFKTALSS